jgi:hypothetical protein
MEDWRSLGREGAKIANRLGSTRVRSFAPTAAGPETPMCYSSLEFNDAASWGTFLDNANKDLEAQLFVERISGHLDSPAEMVYTALALEVPLDNAPNNTGTVSDVWVSKIRAGRVEDAIAFSKEATPIAAANGAIGIHLYWIGPAGSESGRMAWVSEYPDFAAYGRSLDGYAKPEVRQTLERAMSPDAPMEVVQHSVSVEIPLLQ